MPLGSQSLYVNRSATISCAALEQQSLVLWVGSGDGQSHYVAYGKIAKVVPLEGASVSPAHNVGSIQLMHANCCAGKGFHDLLQAPSVVAVPARDCKQAEDAVMHLHQKQNCGYGGTALHCTA